MVIVKVFLNKKEGMATRFHACRVSNCGLGDVRFPVPFPSLATLNFKI